MPYPPEHEARRRQLERDLHEANVAKSAHIAAEREEILQQERVVELDKVRAELDTIVKPMDDPEKTEHLLKRLRELRPLTLNENRILWCACYLIVWRKNFPPGWLTGKA
jgi:hypothetical protein